MTDTAFDEAAARAWLEGPDPDEDGYTIAESLGIGEDFNYESDGWPYKVDALVAMASGKGGGLLPPKTVLWLVSDSEGAIDGALITRDTGPGVRLCSLHQEWIELTTDHQATGIAAAVAILAAVHITASGLVVHPAGDPEQFASLDDVEAVMEVNAFRDTEGPITPRRWAELGFEALRDLEAPVIALRNRAGQEIIVDLANQLPARTYAIYKSDKYAVTRQGAKVLVRELITSTCAAVRFEGDDADDLEGHVRVIPARVPPEQVTEATDRFLSQFFTGSE